MENLEDKERREMNRVSLKEDWEISWWTQRFGVSKEQLEEAVRKVGDSVEKIREYFSQKNNAS